MKLVIQMQFNKTTNIKIILFSVKTAIIKSMEQYCSSLGQIMPDAKNSLLSLQLLDQVEPPEYQSGQQTQHHYYNYDYHYQYDFTSKEIDKVSSCQPESMSQITNTIQYKYEKENLTYISNSDSHVEPRNLFDVQSEDSKNIFDTQSEHRESIEFQKNKSESQQSQIDILQNLDQSDISKQNSREISKRASIGEESRQNHFEHNPQNQLAILKELEEKALATVNQTEYADQVKQNFEMLFQKVYGIIEEIELRNQKSQIQKSTIKCSRKKQLSLTTRVVELSVGKQNQRLKKKKFYNLQTEFDYNMESFQQDAHLKNHMKTQQNIYLRTPCSSASKMMISTNLLSLSKQFPLISPRTNLNSARSDKSIKSKGISLVSAEKKLQFQTKKPVKITLMQKKIVMGPKKKAQAQYPPAKTGQKKTSAFNPNNFFNSRRVSSRII